MNSYTTQNDLLLSKLLVYYKDKENLENLTREKLIEKPEPEEDSEEVVEDAENKSEHEGGLPEASPINE